MRPWLWFVDETDEGVDLGASISLLSGLLAILRTADETRSLVIIGALGLEILVLFPGSVRSSGRILRRRSPSEHMDSMDPDEYTSSSASPSPMTVEAASDVSVSA